METFFQFIWLVIVSFAFVAYLIILFQIVTDLFRDREQKGWHKAIWIVFLIVFPLITAVVYLIARGNGMATRQAAYVKQAQESTDSYIREVAGRSPAQEIADAKALLDAGSISAEEFEKIKAKALS
ncbi:hypothetical protein MLP_02140 [Microlunatus phosphovorus NM-1]|uniref:Cardiolipin synthase N-terminal domain-containing protein n=1 Tax=Microlunatus phosphovorus (strain ATCC 700054 / DSM 10555 / JCM 9379 / NBRC 101784 / NCIMB 13414 / VKM Ac-1990 / NM-1) TaxID=1032480 RepID=F5XHT3_MICPN|nr:SHOCT domain-containing protein [Microlunatus phosphovorus]BAK33228.1 hypothetical protein MLP_02140 [Microlunatus phosphovorus NM-1]